MKKFLATAGLAGTLALGGGLAAQAASATHASASSLPFVSTTSRGEVLISPKCYQENQYTTTFYVWSKKAERYVKLVAPRITQTQSTHCHA